MDFPQDKLHTSNEGKLYPKSIFNLLPPQIQTPQPMKLNLQEIGKYMVPVIYKVGSWKRVAHFYIWVQLATSMPTNQSSSILLHLKRVSNFMHLLRQKVYDQVDHKLYRTCLSITRHTSNEVYHQLLSPRKQTQSLLIQKPLFQATAWEISASFLLWNDQNYRCHSSCSLICFINLSTQSLFYAPAPEGDYPLHQLNQASVTFDLIHQHPSAPQILPLLDQMHRLTLEDYNLIRYCLDHLDQYTVAQDYYYPTQLPTPAIAPWMQQWITHWWWRSAR